MIEGLFVDELATPSLWDFECKRIKAFFILSQIFFAFASLALGLLLFAPFFGSFYALAYYLSIVFFVFFIVLSLVLSFLHQFYLNNGFLIWGIALGKKVDQLLFITIEGLAINYRRTFGRRRLALAALASLGVERTLEPLMAYSAVAPISQKKMIKKAIAEISLRLKSNPTYPAPYSTPSGKPVSFFAIEKNNLRHFMRNMTIFISLAIVTLAAGITYTIIDPTNFLDFIIFYIPAGVILIEVPILYVIMKRKLQHVELLFKAQNVQALMDIAYKGANLYFNYYAVTAAIGALGDLANLESITALQPLLTARRKLIAFKAATIIDALHVRNNLPERFELQL